MNALRDYIANYNLKLNFSQLLKFGSDVKGEASLLNVLMVMGSVSTCFSPVLSIQLMLL